ncbi:MAG TPA: polyprenyl diphosphate synthase [Candidatus Dormibacteraeota bacterium]|nr:polyprenyl diphosphate synthase [Candidatus Dormibacteraeota bacterium]
MSTQTAQPTSISAHQDSVPQHIGLILDGNRRWAKDNGLPSLEGHRRGSEVFKNMAKAAFERGIKYVSVYVFSTENWNRSKEEVGYLMDLFYKLAKKDTDYLHKQNIKVLFIGSLEGLSTKVVTAMREAEVKTKDNTAGTLAICLNYGGQLEIADAVKKMVGDGVKQQEITPEKIDEYLYAPGVPSVDLVIRTSGEQRLSNFMLWRSAYSELLFVKKHWPDFTEADLDEALAEYARRQRRYGS